MQGELPEQRAFVVEYPGQVEDVTAAMETLGGVEAVRKVEMEKQRLSLTWQKGNPVAHSLKFERSAAKSGILRLGRDGTAKIVALVDGVYRCEEICDFAYTPERLPTDTFGKMTSVVTAQGRLFEKMVSEQPHFAPEPLMAVAPRFSKVPFLTEAIMKDKSVPVHVMKGVRLSMEEVCWI